MYNPETPQSLEPDIDMVRHSLALLNKDLSLNIQRPSYIMGDSDRNIQLVSFYGTKKYDPLIFLSAKIQRLAVEELFYRRYSRKGGGLELNSNQLSYPMLLFTNANTFNKISTASDNKLFSTKIAAGSLYVNTKELWKQLDAKNTQVNQWENPVQKLATGLADYLTELYRNLNYDLYIDAHLPLVMSSWGYVIID